MESKKCDLECDNIEGSLNILTNDECEIMKFRFDFPVHILCDPHYKDQFQLYSYRNMYNKCSDPCLRHKSKVISNLREITLDLACKTKKFSEYRIIPGQKLCKKCLFYLNEVITSNEDFQHQEDDDYERTQHNPAPEFDTQPLDSSM